MAYYAYFDHTAQAPTQVLGWYDTELLDYPNLPDSADVLLLTTAEWESRTDNPSGWAVADGVLVPFAVQPPALLLSQQAALQLSTRIGDGIGITSTGNPSLSGTMALDDVTMTEIGSVARDAAAGLGLPGDMPVFVYPTKDGVPQQFTEAQIIAVYKAQRNLLLILNTQAAMMARGAEPAWPTQSATIP